jgi:membrane-bound ClpP family serine protease
VTDKAPLTGGFSFCFPKNLPHSCYNRKDMMTARLIIAIVTTALEEAAIAAVVLWLLPKADIHLPLFVLIIIMVAWAGFAVFSYRMGSRALRRKPEGGLADMLGMRGEVVKRLDPEGMIRIKSELWKAKSAGRKIESGVIVVVVGQKGLKLIVEREKPPQKP